LWVDAGYSGSEAEITDYDWDYSSGWGHWETEEGEMVSIVWVPLFSSGYETIFVRGENVCGEGNWHYETFEVIQNYYYSIYPNPVTDETTLSIKQVVSSDGGTAKSSSTELLLDESVEWQLEIHDYQKNLMLKSSDLKGNSVTINTAGWKKGVYVVRVMYKDQILTGKLMVER
jgi:hypothetical protein